MSSTYTIRLRNCAFFARHGVLAEEAALGQRFFVDLDLSVEPDRPLADDDVASTVDYGVAFGIVETVVTQTRRKLIEALALDIAEALGARFPQIRRAVVTVRKPAAPIAGVLDHAEVSVAWPQ